MSEAQRLSEIEKRVASTKQLYPRDFDALFALGKAEQMKKREISYSEFEKLTKLAEFRCPKSAERDPRGCDGHDCDDESYSRCVDALAAKLKLRKIWEGELRVEGFAVKA